MVFAKDFSYRKAAVVHKSLGLYQQYLLAIVLKTANKGMTLTTEYPHAMMPRKYVQNIEPYIVSGVRVLPAWVPQTNYYFHDWPFQCLLKISLTLSSS